MLVACLAVAGAAAAYLYMVRVLQPAVVTRAVACPPWMFSNLQCGSYAAIVSKPFFLIAGALIGVWLGYAARRLYAAPGQRSFTLREGLVVGPVLLGFAGWLAAVRPAWPLDLHPGLGWVGWGPGWNEVVIFFLLAILIRFLIGIASIAKARGGIILAFGLPVIFAGLGYAFITLFQQPPVGHDCPGTSPRVHMSPQALAQAEAAACTYHPLIAEIWPWVFGGLLAGTWLAFATAVDLRGSVSRDLKWAEWAVALPVVAVGFWWGIAEGPNQAGGGYVAEFVLLVAVAVLLRLLLLARPVARQVSGILTRLGMVPGRQAPA